MNNDHVTTHAKQDFEFHLHLTMGEAAVLIGLFAYGSDSLLKEALVKGGAINEGVTDASRVLDSLYQKTYGGKLKSEYDRCMKLRRVFHNPEAFNITPKERAS